MNALLLLSWLTLSLTAAPDSVPRALGLAAVVDSLGRNGHVALEHGNLLVSTYDFTFRGDTVEAIAFRPAAEGRYAGVLLIPGYSRTARDLIPMGVRLAKEGFAAAAISQRGFGRSTGAPDFVGPKTLAALDAGFRRFRREAYVDSTRMGIFGYSRGGMAASLMAVRMTKQELRAAVFGAGVYDFKRAYDDEKLAGIRENMEQEAGLSAAAIRERTSLTKMSNLPCPVLILHGEQDDRVPVSQAYLLRDELTRLEKPFELKTFPESGHGIALQELYDAMLPFLHRELAPAPSSPGHAAP